MLSMIRRRITFANVAMTVALVFAMSGGAYAAGKFLITSTKQIKPSVLASLKGNAGKAGANGAQGPAGPAGPAGATGSQGPAGAVGAKGEAGAEGKAGKEGKAGVAGSPWTAGGTLPSGKTETGVWSFGPFESNQPEDPTIFMDVPIAFTIPLAAPLREGHAHFIAVTGKEINFEFEEVTSTACLGTAAQPTAQPGGNLCIYAISLDNAVAGSPEIQDPAATNESGSAGTTGALLVLGTTKLGRSSGFGTWAVTAE
jgi:hypothetical protein